MRAPVLIGLDPASPPIPPSGALQALKKCDLRTPSQRPLGAGWVAGPGVDGQVARLAFVKDRNGVTELRHPLGRASRQLEDGGGQAYDVDGTVEHFLQYIDDIPPGVVGGFGYQEGAEANE